MPKEIPIELNTKSGQSTFTTEKVTGKLDAVIVNSEEKVDLMIQSELGYFILKRGQFQGIEYIAPRVRAVAQYSDSVGLQDQPHMDNFQLNERLIFILMGPEGTKVDIILRFS